MSVVAIIEDPKELGKIIDWAQHQEREPQLTVCSRSPPEPVLMSVYYPKNGVYAEQDKTSKSLLIRLCGKGIPLGSEKIA